MIREQRTPIDFPSLLNTLDAVGRFLASFNARARLEAERQARVRREQRILANLEAWSTRNEWARRVAAMKAMQLIPDRLHPAYRGSCMRNTKERIT